METGRLLIIAGAVIMLVGFLLVFADKIPLGRLPGDISFGDRIRIHIPIVTCILLSIVITLIVNFFSRK